MESTTKTINQTISRATLALAIVAAFAISGCESMRTGTDTASTANKGAKESQHAEVKGMSGKPDAQMQAVLDQLAALGGKPIVSLSAEEARKQPTPADAVKALLQSQGKSTAPMPVARVQDGEIPGPAGPIKARIYTPEGAGPFPVIVYYHGGGWVIANLDTYDASPRALANAAKAIVVSSHYRQAPEHKFPAAHEDAFAAYQWVLNNAVAFNGNPNRVSVVGESAGGNLAAAVALMAREAKLPMPVHQVLVYPVANAQIGSESEQQNAEAKPLNTPMLTWFYEKYLPTPADKNSPLIALTEVADLKGLPPATIITAQIDPLRSEGRAYAEKLEQAGVPVDYRNYEGVTHEFFGMGAVVDKAKEAVQQAAAGILGANKVSSR
ncbi:MAG: alpha/beta hydrolase [Pseudomonadota bacterium]|nr:alpha/beta hydrolase [Pseudomonadota bacterium]